MEATSETDESDLVYLEKMRARALELKKEIDSMGPIPKIDDETLEKLRMEEMLELEESRRRESLELYDDLMALAEITGGEDLFYAAAAEAKKSGLGEDKIKDAAHKAYGVQLQIASLTAKVGHENTLFYALTPAYTASDFNISQQEKMSIAESVSKNILGTIELCKQFKQKGRDGKGPYRPLEAVMRTLLQNYGDREPQDIVGISSNSNAHSDDYKAPPKVRMS